MNRVNRIMYYFSNKIIHYKQIINAHKNCLLIKRIIIIIYTSKHKTLSTKCSLCIIKISKSIISWICYKETSPTPQNFRNLHDLLLLNYYIVKFSQSWFFSRLPKAAWILLYQNPLSPYLLSYGWCYLLNAKFKFKIFNKSSTTAHLFHIVWKSYLLAYTFLF